MLMLAASITSRNALMIVECGFPWNFSEFGQLERWNCNRRLYAIALGEVRIEEPLKKFGSKHNLDN